MVEQIEPLQKMNVFNMNCIYQFITVPSKRNEGNCPEGNCPEANWPDALEIGRWI